MDLENIPMNASEKLQFRRFDALMKKTADGVCRRLQTVKGEHHTIRIPIPHTQKDHLTPEDVETILTSDTPMETLQYLAEENFTHRDIHETLNDAIAQSYAEDFTPEESAFLRSYMEQNFPDEADTEVFYESYYPIGTYDVQRSPLLNQKIPLDILYLPYSKALDYDLLHSTAPINEEAPLCKLAKQQGNMKSFCMALRKARRGGHDLDIQNPFVDAAYGEAKIATLDTKLVFLASAPLRDCIRIREAQIRQKNSPNPWKAAIVFPQNTVAGEYDFQGNAGGYFFFEGVFRKPVMLPIKDIHLHNDDARLADIRHYRPVQSVITDRSAWKSRISIHIPSEKNTEKRKNTVPAR